MYNNHTCDQNKFKILAQLFKPLSSLPIYIGCYFKVFSPQNISLLPKIVTEAHANLKKKKTSCNTTLKHYADMVKYTPLERSSLSSLICQRVVFFLPIYSSSIHHQSSYGLQCITAQCTVSPCALSLYELKEGRFHALVRLVHCNQRCENRFCLHKRVNRRTGKNSKTLWERPFPGDTLCLREGTESLTPVEYP